MPKGPIAKPPIDQNMQDAEGKKNWARWFENLLNRNAYYLGTGTTAQRPTEGLYTGVMYLDTTLGKPIWYLEGTGWIDATGSTV